LCLQLGHPNDWTSCIEYNPATLWLGSTWIKWSKMLVPIARKVNIAVALESFVAVRLETSSQVSSLLQVTN
jgi:hypothetical protein